MFRLKETLESVALEGYNQRELLFGEENMRELEKVVMLRVVDSKWMEHLDHMDMLREGINLRAVFRFPVEAYAEQLLPSGPRKRASGAR